jgi:hypothetical protein
MTIERVHPLERFVATLTLVWPIIEMKLLVALAVMGPCKPFPAPRPLALEWFLLVM